MPVPHHDQVSVDFFRVIGDFVHRVAGEQGARGLVTGSTQARQTFVQYGLHGLLFTRHHAAVVDTAFHGDQPDVQGQHRHQRQLSLRPLRQILAVQQGFLAAGRAVIGQQNTFVHTFLLR